MKIACTIESWNCANQSVFVRADLNVPLAHGKILNDRRLTGIQKTLDVLIKKEAIIILASHIGRPKGTEPELSTRILLPWFEKKGYTIRFCKNIEEIKEQQKSAPSGSLLLLENLRFFPGEKTRDNAFIKALRSVSEWYVNDAFGTLHRNDASLAELAYTFPAKKRSIGYLVEKELTMLNEFSHKAKKPVCAILGGGKVTDKLPLINHLLENVDCILLCPALVFTFEVARNRPVGNSLVDYDAVSKAQAIMKKAELMNVPFVFPVDYQIARGSFDGPLSLVESNAFPDDGFGISIGPKTLSLFNEYIQKSGTIFFNGMIGFPNRTETLNGVKQLLTNVAHSDAISIVAGGNSIGIADQLQLKGITYYSTGGGATLTYLSGKKLPGLAPFY
jgi:phosphoglycerate kinase